MKSAFLALLAFVALVACASAELAPLHKAETGRAIAGEYLVLMKADMIHEDWEAYLSDMNRVFATDVDGQIVATYTIGNTFKALHVRTSEYAVQFMRSHPAVELIEENQVQNIQEACTAQNGAIWNLQRINTHPISGMDGKYSYNNLASNIDAYIVDTGILITHEEFSGGRAIWGYNAVNDGKNTDCQGHGTHVAGTVGGRTVGVARGVTLIAVKVLGCDGSGTNSGVISGINWVVTNARSRGRKSVANMSLGGGYSATLNRAVAAAVDAGVTFSVAAGNEDQNACNVSPASEAKAITVGATYFSGSYSQDIRASFSNWGTCVDVLAPGQSIKSAWIGSNSAYHTISGTSMASPHVCGVTALIASANPSYSPADIKAKILADSTANAIDMKCTKNGCSSTPNKLLFTARC